MTAPTPPSTSMSTSLVALKERRTQVIAALSHAFARDELDIDELDRRLELVHRASSVAELEALAPGHEPQLALAPVTVRSLTSGLSVGMAQDRPARQSMMSMMGGVQRTGPWTVPQRLNLYCLMGGMSLDFREADLTAGVTEVAIHCLMGGVEVIVPPNVKVEVAGSAILGGFDQGHPGADALASEPVATLRITGFAIMGGVGVETRRIGESSRQARKRIKGERKRLLDGAHGGRAALPAAVVVPERKQK